MVVDDACDFGSKISLGDIQDVVVDQGDFGDLLRFVKFSKCIPEEEIVLWDLAVLEVHGNL